MEIILIICLSLLALGIFSLDDGYDDSFGN